MSLDHVFAPIAEDSEKSKLISEITMLLPECETKELEALEAAIRKFHTPKQR